jgi:hypothetical protein
MGNKTRAYKKVFCSMRYNTVSIRLQQMLSQVLFLVAFQPLAALQLILSYQFLKSDAQIMCMGDFGAVHQWQ